MLRDFKPGDRQAFIEMANQFYHSDAVLHAVPDANFELTFEYTQTRPELVRGLIFEMDSEMAGYALLSFTYSNEVGGMAVWLEEAFILPEFRGKGLGTELLSFVEEDYRGKIGRFRLEVEPRNEAAVRLYERLGYKKLDYLQMYKEL